MRYLRTSAFSIRLWKITAGKGDSSPVVAGRRVDLLARQDEQEIVRAFDLRTGRELWRAVYATSVPHLEILKEDNQVVSRNRLLTKDATALALWRLN